MSIKNLKKSWKKKNLKELDKMSRLEVVYDAIPELIELVSNPKKGERLAEKFGDIADENSLISIILSKKFIKSVKSIIKDDEFTNDVGFVMVLNAIITMYHSSLDEELLEELTSIIKKLLKERTKKVAKKTKLSPEVAQEFLVILPDVALLENPNRISMFTDKMLMKAYTMAKDKSFEIDEKTLKKLFTMIAGEESLVNIATGILLQRKAVISKFDENQLKVWNTATTFALNVLEKSTAKEINRAVNFYNKIVENTGDAARRINLATLGEDYPKISSVVTGNKVVKKKK